MVTFKDVTAAFGIVPVIKAINWHWQSGQQWAIIGGNGAGKTALAHLITGRLRPQRGSIRWRSDLSPQRDIITIDFESQRQLMVHDDRFDDSESRMDAFDVGTTVKDVILQQKKITDGFSALVAQWDIESILDRGIRFISTGESRKMLLASALYAKPKLLIIDNPFAGLDQQTRHQFRLLLNQHLPDDLPILLLLQHIDDLPDNIDHVLWLEQGTVRCSGKRSKVLPIIKQSLAHGIKTAGPLPPPLPRPYALNHHAPLLELKHVNVSYGDTPVLFDINWRMDWGQHSCITGPNGAGKSTLLSLLCGDNHKAYGQAIDLFGQRKGSGESIWEIKQKFGIVNTKLHLEYPHHTPVIDVVASGIYDTLGLYQTCSEQAKRLALAWLRTLELDDKAKQSFHQLSFGQQRLVLLGRAMVKSPLILILDEPCLGLDDRHCQLFLSLIDKIAHSGQSHILYVSHMKGERPSCINQWVALRPHSCGGFTAHFPN